MAVNGVPEMMKNKERGKFDQRSFWGGFLASGFLYMVAFVLWDSSDEICVWITEACRCIDTKLFVHLIIWHILLKYGTALIAWRRIIWHGFTVQLFDSSWHPFEILSVIRAEKVDEGDTLATVMWRNNNFLTTSSTVSFAKPVKIFAICDGEEFSSEIQEDPQGSGNKNVALTNGQDYQPTNKSVLATLLSRNIDKHNDANSTGHSTTALRHDKVDHEEKEMPIIPMFKEWVQTIETDEPKTLGEKEKRKLTDEKAKRIKHKSCKKQSLDEAVRTSSTGNVKAWLGLTGKCLSLVTTPKKLAIVLTLMVWISSIHTVNTAVPHHQIEEQFLKYSILMTPQCNDVELMKRSRCSADDYTGSVYIEMCGFSQLCTRGTRPFCLNTQRGMAHICLPENTVCPKGQTREFWVENSDMAHVLATDVKCPVGTYQPTISSCTNACQFIHRDLAMLGNQYVVHSNGDHVSPTYVYCNYRHGFYSPEGKFLIDIDADDSNACIHTAIYNPCVRDQTPLPNGTCVNPCAKGSCRDDHDGFHCKMKHIDTDCKDSEDVHEETLVFVKVNDNSGVYRPTGLMTEERTEPMGDYKIAITVLIAVTIVLCISALVALALLKDEEDGKMMPVDKWI